MHEPQHRDVTICEVGPRDGLQMVGDILPTETKLRWIEALARTGLPEIDAASFVPAASMPQFTDAADIVSSTCRLAAPWRVGALAPNRKGAERALAAGAQTKIVADIVGLCQQEAGRRALVCGTIPTSFGCSIEGRVAEIEVCRIAADLVDCGVDEIGLADTVGYADPALVKARVKAVRRVIGEDIRLRLHFHDTMGLGLANVLAGFEAGVRVFDAASGGLGGCPFAPGASGNVATEDLVFMLEQMGVRTGVDLDRLNGATDILARALPNERLRSHVREAGRTHRPELRRF